MTQQSRGYGMTLTTLCTQLAEAVAKDEEPEVGGFDLSAGMFGPNVSNWLREVAAVLGEGSKEKVVREATAVVLSELQHLGKNKKVRVLDSRPIVAYNHDVPIPLRSGADQYEYIGTIWTLRIFIPKEAYDQEGCDYLRWLW